jgi:mannosyltransferase OCH1-like enzyme
MTKEEIREYQREWRKKHPDYYKKYFKEHYIKIKEQKSLFQRILKTFKKFYKKPLKIFNKKIKGGQDESAKRVLHG